MMYGKEKKEEDSLRKVYFHMQLLRLAST